VASSKLALKQSEFHRGQREFVVSSTSRASAVGSGKQSGGVRSQAQVTQREVGKVKKEDKDGSSDGEDPFKALSQVCAVLGTQWGDEGKGKLVDILAQRYDIVARCQVSL
jgi:adenylosuccinate synthase